MFRSHYFLPRLLIVSRFTSNLFYRVISLNAIQIMSLPCLKYFTEISCSQDKTKYLTLIYDYIDIWCLPQILPLPQICSICQLHWNTFIFLGILCSLPFSVTMHTFPLPRIYFQTKKLLIQVPRLSSTDTLSTLPPCSLVRLFFLCVPTEACVVDLHHSSYYTHGGYLWVSKSRDLASFIYSPNSSSAWSTVPKTADTWITQGLGVPTPIQLKIGI